MQIYIKYSLLCREFYKKSQNLIVWNIFLPQPGDIEAIDAAARDEQRDVDTQIEEVNLEREDGHPLKLHHLDDGENCQHYHRHRCESGDDAHHNHSG